MATREKTAWITPVRVEPDRLTGYHAAARDWARTRGMVQDGRGIWPDFVRAALDQFSVQVRERRRGK